MTLNYGYNCNNVIFSVWRVEVSLGEGLEKVEEKEEKKEVGEEDTKPTQEKPLSITIYGDQGHTKLYKIGPDEEVKEEEREQDEEEEGEKEEKKNKNSIKDKAKTNKMKDTKDGDSDEVDNEDEEKLPKGTKKQYEVRTSKVYKRF